ncbi:uncharacterized protein BROUX77_000822 [Berkeleyomyces rouxiae]|uniref:uncharacterized protein n=1 Tax=Berkeleyomyces rouxiae TaxID=2035830 RepID=UPI003B784D1E
MPTDTSQTWSNDQTLFLDSESNKISSNNYNYTGSALFLLLQDAYLCLRHLRSFPSVILPLTPCNSGPMNELYLSPQNIARVTLQLILMFFQLLLLVALLPLSTIPIWIAVIYIAIFILINNFVCWLFLNGDDNIYWSNPELVAFDGRHSQEQWIFINGVGTGQQWLQNSIDRLSLTFCRPIMGIHNRT